MHNLAQSIGVFVFDLQVLVRQQSGHKSTPRGYEVFDESEQAPSSPRCRSLSYDGMHLDRLCISLATVQSYPDDRM